ncbi:hypothetical protein [Paenibacillus typhae]|uniref:hypothetical protein n=1 Tax=Paenibacillus typhae TaxID=1174501 RepID=UPI001C8ED87F|nr:hypothetical protein [Paenibacillus typhae]MBY0012651.1 hypothetical protein [Paenibacillus typhae]
MLKQAAERLADWKYPKLPEDLCFLKKEGGEYLYSIVHERIYGMEVAEEGAGPMGRITGLFMELAVIRELPNELIKLKKLQVLDLGMCRFRRSRTFCRRCSS